MTLSFPAKARLIMGGIHGDLSFMLGQLIGLAAEWPEGVDAQAQFVRNLRASCKNAADKIEDLDTEVYRPTPDEVQP